jgi:cell division protein ZapA (FtsZ GTPase activity inhibitor)
LKKAIEIQINGHKLVVKSAEGNEHLRNVEDYLNNKIEEVKEKTKAASTLDLALLAALNITGEVIKTTDAHTEIKKRSQQMSKEINRRLEQT